ncbi:hypothetical protein ABT160_14135 [Streptomyces sp. NPDC001941]|uniref:hypothetical protein n=1 Tax=Streptomyces sp. NPDC001941 TaxID=3154659 RepID=UPI003332193A
MSTPSVDQLDHLLGRHARRGSRARTALRTAIGTSAPGPRAGRLDQGPMLERGGLPDAAPRLLPPPAPTCAGTHPVPGRTATAPRTVTLERAA